VSVAVACSLFFWASSGFAAAPPLGDRDLAVRLIAALNDPDPDVRANLSQALAKIGPTAVEPLLEALANSVPERHAEAAAVLGFLGPVAKSALPQLLNLLDDKETEVRRQASQAIIRVLPSFKPTAKPTGGQGP